MYISSFTSIWSCDARTSAINASKTCDPHENTLISVWFGGWGRVQAVRVTDPAYCGLMHYCIFVVAKNTLLLVALVVLVFLLLSVLL